MREGTYHKDFLSLGVLVGDLDSHGPTAGFEVERLRVDVLFALYGHELTLTLGGRDEDLVRDDPLGTLVFRHLATALAWVIGGLGREGDLANDWGRVGVVGTENNAVDRGVDDGNVLEDLDNKGTFSQTG